MTAVILAAGRGGRLREITGDLPKCLAHVGPCTIIERQLRILRLSGIATIVVITGYRAEAVQHVCGAGVAFVHNPQFAATDSLYSLWLARDLLHDGFVVLNCDVVFHQQLMMDLLTARHEDALLMAACDEDDHYSDEEMKLRVRRGRVIEIAKTINAADADGESLGIARFGRAGSALLVEEMNRLIAAGAVKDWLPSAFAGFCRRRALHAIDHRGLPWIEIDSPQDYRRACLHIAPAIDDPAPTCSPSVAAIGGGTRERDPRLIGHV